MKKSGPNYQFKYQSDHFDYFGIYDLEDGQVYLVPSEVLKQNKSAINLRKEKPKNNQNKLIHLASDYALEKILVRSG